MRVGVHVVEFNGEPVVTFAMVDQIHERPEGTAGRTFRENRERFVEGEDFIEVPWEFGSTKTVEPTRGGNRKPQILITRRGYLKLVKPLTDDRAWAVQGEMIDRYFVVEQIAEVLAGDDMRVEDFSAVGLSIAALSERLDDISKSVAKLSPTIPVVNATTKVSEPPSVMSLSHRRHERDLHVFERPIGLG